MSCHIDLNTILKDDTTDLPIEGSSGPLQSTIDVSRYAEFSVQIFYTGATVGDFQVEASLDEDLGFVPEPDSVTAVDAGGGNIFLNFCCLTWVKARVVIPAGVTGATVRFAGSLGTS